MEKGNFQGNGVFNWPSGNHWTGKFVKDCMHGKGVFYTKSSNSKKYINYDMDKKISEEAM